MVVAVTSLEPSDKARARARVTSATGLASRGLDALVQNRDPHRPVSSRRSPARPRPCPAASASRRATLPRASTSRPAGRSHRLRHRRHHVSSTPWGEALRQPRRWCTILRAGGYTSLTMQIWLANGLERLRNVRLARLRCCRYHPRFSITASTRRRWRGQPLPAGDGNADPGIRGCLWYNTAPGFFVVVNESLTGTRHHENNPGETHDEYPHRARWRMQRHT